MPNLGKHIPGLPISIAGRTHLIEADRQPDPDSMIASDEEVEEFLDAYPRLAARRSDEEAKRELDSLIAELQALIEASPELSTLNEAISEADTKLEWIALARAATPETK